MEFQLIFNLVEKRAVCLMVVGDKYLKMFNKYRGQFESYAQKCNAKLEFITQPPDKTFYRPILAQKLLIPSLFTNYDKVLFLDLDILIHPDAPDVFKELPEDKSFSAVLDPRNTPEFKRTWQHIPRIMNETVSSYFTDRNFDDSPNLVGSINGGVLLFKPKEVAQLFSKYYFSEHNQGKLNSFEETPMAYITQTRNLFHPMNKLFNVQVLYQYRGTDAGEELLKTDNCIPKFLKRKLFKNSGLPYLFTRKYIKFIRAVYQNSYFTHFAGNFKIPKL